MSDDPKISFAAAGVDVDTSILELKMRMSRALHQVRPLFKDARMTLVARSESLPDGYVVLTDDDLDLAVKTIEKAKGRPAV